MPDPKCDTQQAFGISHAAAYNLIGLNWQLITVMSAVSLMNNEENVIQDKEKQPVSNSNTSCNWV